MFSSPNVVQNRNEHNLLDDFKDEYEMYINNENILNIIENNLDNKTDIITIIKTNKHIYIYIHYDIL